jgi:hypothetical protein
VYLWSFYIAKDDDVVKKILLSGSISDRFDEITDRLMRLAQDLQLGISIQQLFNREEDREAQGTNKYCLE